MGLKELRRRLAIRPHELHTMSLAERFEGVGDVPIGSAPTRRPVRVAGEVVRQRIVPRAGSPVLELTISDGTGELVLIFTGRLTIGGLGHGRGVVVTGVAHHEHGRPVMLNPGYELLAS